MSYFGETTVQLTAGQFCGIIQEPNEGKADTYKFDQDTLIGSLILKYTRTEQFVFSGFASTTIRTSQYIEQKPYIYTNVEFYLEWILDNLSDALATQENKNSKSAREIRKGRGLQLLDTKNCGPISSDRRIVGGNLTAINEFPWAALIKYKKRRGSYVFECGGSLISDR